MALARVRREQSEIRERRHTLLSQEERTEAEVDELRTLETRSANLEVEHRAAEALQPATETREVTSDPEKRERQELRSAASLTNYVVAAIRGREVSGAELELRQASGVDGIPLELFYPTETRQQRQGVEMRADMPSLSPTTGTAVNVEPIFPMIYSRSILPRLGVDMPEVVSGQFSTMTVSTGLTAAAYAAGTAAESTAAVLTPKSTGPHRISARLSLRLEDIVTVGPSNFEAILRQNLMLAMSDQLDGYGLNGDGAGANPSGLLTKLTDPTSDPSDVATFDAFVEIASEGIDAGPWAMGLGDIVLVFNAETQRLAETTFQASATYKGELSAAAYLRREIAGLYGSSRMPATDSDIATVIRYRRGGMMGSLDGVDAVKTATCPVYAEISVDDIYSDSASATHHLTLHHLIGDVIVIQPLAYQQDSLKVSA